MFLVVKKVERTSFVSLRHIKRHIFLQFMDLRIFIQTHLMCFALPYWTMRIFFFCLGTWQTYIVKDQDVWHKINKDSPMEYAATITVNPLTALKMLEDFVTLNSGTGIFLILVLYTFTCLTLTSLV